MIKIKGSDTEVNLTVRFAEEFKNSKSNFSISVSGGGSGLGITSLINGTTDIANSSRRINVKELKLFEENSLVIDSFVFATDAIAFIVSEDNPLDSISHNDLASILSGKITHWVNLGGQKTPINIYGRQSNSGTYEFIKGKLNIEFSVFAKQLNGNAQILEAIKADKSGIGYVGAGYIMSKGSGIKVLKTYYDDHRAISPLDYEAITQGRYFFQRPLYQYYLKKDFEKFKTFFDFESSSIGERIIRESGYYPIKAD